MASRRTRRQQRQHLEMLEGWAQAQALVNGARVLPAFTYELVQMLNRASLDMIYASDARQEWEGEAVATLLVSTHPPFIPILKKLAAEGYRFVTLRPQFAKALADMDLPARALASFATDAHRRAGFSEAAGLLGGLDGFEADGLSPGATDFLEHDLRGFLYPRLADLCVVPWVLSSIGIDGVPALYLNGRRIGGLIPLDELERLISAELGEKGQR